MKLVLDHADRTRSAARQAFGELDAELPIRRHRDRVVMIDGRPVNPGRLAQPVHQLVGARHGTGQGPAHPDVVFPGRLPAESWIKGRHFQHLDGLQPQLVRHPHHGLVREVAKVTLQRMQGRQDCTPFHWIMRDSLIHLLFHFGRNLERHGPAPCRDRIFVATGFFGFLAHGQPIAEDRATRLGVAFPCAG